MSAEIRYTSRRREVWNWYWKSWRSGLWRFHLALVAVIVTWMFVLRGSAPTAVWVTRAVGLSALAIAALALYPQLRFKDEERTLTADAEGIRTIIRGKAAFKSWKEVSLIRHDLDSIVIATAKKNAFIVPPRAFESERKRIEFYDYIQKAKTEFDRLSDQSPKAPASSPSAR